MRLKGYLHQSIQEQHFKVISDPKHIAELVNKNCSQILKEYQRINRPALFRGIGGSMANRDFVQKEGRIKDRIPKDTPEWAHKYMNKRAQELYGWPVRNGISTTTDLNQAGTYGRAFAIFPFDGFKFAFIDSIYDLFSAIDNKMNTIFGNISDPEDAQYDLFQKYGEQLWNFQSVRQPIPEVESIIDYFIEGMETQYLKYAWGGPGNQTEVMINSKYYYLVAVNIASDIVGYHG